jgi:hypothetical protein
MVKSHLGCLELCTPAYSLHPKLHFDTNFIFVSLLVLEIFPIWKVLSWENEGFVSGFPLFYDASKSAKICPMVIGCPFTSWWIVEKRSRFSYLGQNQKNDQLTFLPILCNFLKVCSATCQVRCDGSQMLDGDWNPNIGSCLKGLRISFHVLPLFSKSFHFWVSFITFCNFLEMGLPSLKGLKQYEGIKR